MKGDAPYRFRQVQRMGERGAVGHPPPRTVSSPPLAITGLPSRSTPTAIALAARAGVFQRKHRGRWRWAYSPRGERRARPMTCTPRYRAALSPAPALRPLGEADERFRRTVYRLLSVVLGFLLGPARPGGGDHGCVRHWQQRVARCARLRIVVTLRSARAVAARLYRRRGGCCCRASLDSGLPWPTVALFTSNPTGTTSIFG
jgi:hypothetical protein